MDGETEAFEEIIRRHEKMIFNLLYRRLGDYDEAADAAQDVFLAAFRSLRQFRAEARLSTWLYRIAVNHSKTRKSRLAKAERRSVSLEAADSDRDGGPIASIPHPGPDPAEEVEQREAHAQIQQALNGLKKSDAMIILLHDVQNVPYEDIARILDIRMGTVKSRLHRARLALKDRLLRQSDPEQVNR